MKLLLHMCCGPCSCYPVKVLQQEGVEITGYFFNPNIHPYKEWDTRLKTAKIFAETVGIDFVADKNYRLRDFLTKALVAEKEEGGRCRMCYQWRLSEAARYAKENNFDAFTSTLFYSIYQKHDLMRETAERYAKIYGTTFYYRDFRPGWQEGIDISKAMDLYRQAYCGCIFSEEERYSKAIHKERRRKAREQRRMMEAQKNGESQ